MSGAGLRTLRHAAGREGAYKLTLSLTSKSKATLRKHRPLKLSVHVSFKPSTGASSTAVLSVAIR